MTAPILMLFYLIMPPHAATICALWLTHAATLTDLQAACPANITLENYQVEFIEWSSGKLACENNATAIYSPEICNLPGRLDNYRMAIIEPAKNEKLLCSVQSYNNPPDRNELAKVCDSEAMTAYDNQDAKLRYMGLVTIPSKPTPIILPDIPQGPGLFDQISNAADLVTNDQLDWLVNRLLWTGQTQKDTANADMRAWQNQFDEDIYSAALSENVPARLLKRVLKYESQFWPSWGMRPAGEVGMAQITIAAADQYLRWYDPSYPSASQNTQLYMQYGFLNKLRCDICNLQQQVAQERKNIVIYAQILKAYRYGANDWSGALELWNGEDYMRKVEDNS